jgi:hypothetical protein
LLLAKKLELPLTQKNKKIKKEVPAGQINPTNNCKTGRIVKKSLSSFFLPSSLPYIMRKRNLRARIRTIINTITIIAYQSQPAKPPFLLCQIFICLLATCLTDS